MLNTSPLINSAQIFSPDYDLAITTCSFFIAAAASYATTLLNEYFTYLKRSDAKTIRYLRLLSGCTLGFGIWGMHFVGMAAVHLPFQITYDPYLSAMSFFPALICGVLVSKYITKPVVSSAQWALYSLYLALGISAMHYIGMHALLSDAIIIHSPVLMIISLWVSWLLSCAALKIHKGAYLFLKKATKNQIALLSASTFGAAVSTMHYVAMQASEYFYIAGSQVKTGVSVDHFVTIIVVMSLFVTFFLFFTLIYKKQSLDLNRKIDSIYVQISDLVESFVEPTILVKNNGIIAHANSIFLQSFPSVGIDDLESMSVARLLAELHGQRKLLNKDFLYELSDWSCGEKVIEIDKQAWVYRTKSLASGGQVHTWTNVTHEFNNLNSQLSEKTKALIHSENLRRKGKEEAELSQLQTFNRMLCTLSHEVNTPIGIILTSLTSLSKENEIMMASISSNKISKAKLLKFMAKIASYEGLIERNIRKAIDAMEKLKVIPDNNYRFTRKKYRLHTLLENTFSSLSFPETGTPPSISIICKEKNYIVISQRAIHDIFKHLYDNALTHAFDPNITPKIEVEVIESLSDFTVYFKDNGIGIKPSLIDSIFEPFISSKVFKGHFGLGLYMAKHIAKYYLNGDLALHKTGPNGTVFKLTIGRLN